MGTHIYTVTVRVSDLTTRIVKIVSIWIRFFPVVNAHAGLVLHHRIAHRTDISVIYLTSSKNVRSNQTICRDYKKNIKTRKDLSEAIKDVKELKMGRQLQADKLTTIQRELQEQKLLHSQLRDEVSTEFRSLYQKIAGQQKSIDLLKYQVRVNTKKFSLDVENLRWEMTTNRKLDMPSLTDLELGRKERE